MAAPIQEPDFSKHTFVVPSKQILNPMLLAKWEKSQAYTELIGFILTLNESVKRLKISDDYPVSPMVDKLVALLDELDKWIDETPPVNQPSRFGNAAFRTWFGRLKQDSPKLLKDALPPEYEPAIIEVSSYLIEGVGNDTRIDYGSGHELSFVAFLCCLCKLGIFKPSDHAALVLRIFDRYLRLVRKLQLTYRMEPAGSHGVYSIDDFQFLPFLWGSAQLLDNVQLSPESYTTERNPQIHHQDFLFMAAVKYINEVKTGPFFEHSNVLWSMSAVPTWSKINSGLIKMYKAEVLAKFPVIQHFFFGSLLTLDPAT